MNLLSFFKSDTIQKDENLQSAPSPFLSIMREQTILTRTIHALSAMADDNMMQMAMWVKDPKHRYIYGNQRLRDDLFNGCELTAIIGKTDSELINDPDMLLNASETLLNIEPHDLPNINTFLNEGTRVCNLTDIITASFGHVCHYIETIENKLLYVKKTPMTEGTVGSYIDVTHKQDSIMKAVNRFIIDQMAYRIDSLESYYLNQEAHKKIMEIAHYG
ncbi:MAG: hypothetical protein HQK65_04530 [Desulfamplus sp.]|nr:hypothetical protein [Desulfamplus sp.]